MWLFYVLPFLLACSLRMAYSQVKQESDVICVSKHTTEMFTPTYHVPFEVVCQETSVVF